MRQFCGSSDPRCQTPRTGGGGYYPFESHAKYIRKRTENHIFPNGEIGWDYMRRTGVWMDTAQQPFYEYYNWELSETELEGATFDAETGLYKKVDLNNREKVIGVFVDGKARRGFPTPSRKFTVRHPDMIEAGKRSAGLTMACRVSFRSLRTNMADDRLHLVSFKGATYQPTGEKVGSAVVRAIVTEGIHPRVLAMSNSLGHKFGGRAATAANGSRQKILALQLMRQRKILILYHACGGIRPQVAQALVTTYQPSPLIGMQAWYDTTCTIRRV